MDKKKLSLICKECKAKCCTMGGADFTSSEKNKVIKAGHDDHFRKIAANHYEVISKKGICPYLNKENGCSIYNVRPAMCRSWLVYVNYSKDKREYVLMDCPLTKHLKRSQISDLKKQARKIQKRIVKGSVSKSKLSKNEIKLIMNRLNSFSKNNDYFAK